MARYIGARQRRHEDRRLLTGAGTYVGDMSLSGMVHAAVFRSPLAHAAIRGVSVERARALPSVPAAFTAADLGPVGRIPMRLSPRPALRECPAGADRPVTMGPGHLPAARHA